MKLKIELSYISNISVQIKNGKWVQLPPITCVSCDFVYVIDERRWWIINQKKILEKSRLEIIGSGVESMDNFVDIQEVFDKHFHCTQHLIINDKLLFW